MQYGQANEIVFVPHSFLHYFPLHLLELSLDSTENKNKEKGINSNININTNSEIQSRPLIQTHVVSYLPTTSILQFHYLQKKNDSETVDNNNKSTSHNTISPCNAFGVNNEGKDPEFLEKSCDSINLIQRCLYRKP